MLKLINQEAAATPTVCVCVCVMQAHFIIVGMLSNSIKKGTQSMMSSQSLYSTSFWGCDWFTGQLI